MNRCASHPVIRSVAWAVLAAAASLSVQADTLGSAASSASSAGSASVGSLSDSVQGSSQSSGGDKKVAAGEYRVLAVTLVDGPDAGSGPLRALRVQLERVPPAAGGAEAADTVVLRVPEKALGARALTVGDRVWVQERAYGLAFARADDSARTEPFFLAVTDAWRRDLAARPISL